MAFTPKDRARLADARHLVQELETKERAALDVAIDVLLRAGLSSLPGTNWEDLVRDHAEVIRDALEPFDSKVRAIPMPEA